MKNATFAALLPLLLVACVARTTEPVVDDQEPEARSEDRVTKPAKDVLTPMLPDSHSAGETVEINGAEIFAIVAKGAEADTPYLVLHEAMEAEVCTIRETGAVNAEGEQIEGDVNTLLVSNTGDRPIFLMAGDLVLGGKQDRVLSESVVVDPGVADQRIPVFCVEQGRWAVQTKDGEHAKSGTFANEAQTGQVDFNVKSRAIYAQNQSAVWSEVARTNSALKVHADSGTFRAAYDDEETAKNIEAAYADAAKLVGDGVVGFAVVHDGEVVAMDLFDSAGLARKVSEKLLRGYIITAIGNGYALTLDRKLARKTISLECAEQDVRSAAASLGELLELEITVDEEVEGSVNLKLEDVDGLSAVLALAEAVETSATVTDGGIRLGVVEELSDYAPEQNSSGIFTRRGREGGTIGGLVASDESSPPENLATNPNERTTNSREYEKEAVKYSCEDKTTGRKVQTSYMRR